MARTVAHVALPQKAPTCATQHHRVPSAGVQHVLHYESKINIPLCVSLFLWRGLATPPPEPKTLWPTSTIRCLKKVTGNSLVGIRCSRLYSRDRWGMWGVWKWWGACVERAGCGFSHRGPFSQSRLVRRTRDRSEAERAPRNAHHFLACFPCQWSSFSEVFPRATLSQGGRCHRSEHSFSE